MDNMSMSMLGWVIAACAVGFLISAVFAGWLKLSRHLFLFPYVLIAGIFLASFTTRYSIDLAALWSKNWAGGILAGGLVGLYLVKTVQAQPASRQATGASLLVDLAWAGLVYGMMDALFLNIMPVVAIRAAASQSGWAASLPGKIGIGVLGLLASLLVTLTYHLGYPEFRNQRVILVLAGNSLITLAFLLSGSPIGSLISHTAMHLAAVWRGPETTIQLPPHYLGQVKF